MRSFKFITEILWLFGIWRGQLHASSNIRKIKSILTYKLQPATCSHLSIPRNPKESILLKALVLVAPLLLVGCNMLNQPSSTISYPHNSPTPEFLPIIYPGANSILTNDQFLQPSIKPVEEFAYLQDNSPGICIRFDPISILEDSDSGLEFSDYQSRMIWNLNDENIFLGRDIYIRNFLEIHGERQINLDTGETTIIKPFNGVGPYDICAPIEIDQLKEQNKVEFTIASTSGIHHTYTWSFNIHEG